MLPDGLWVPDDRNIAYHMRVGSIFRATIIRRGTGLMPVWYATLNGNPVVETGDLEFAMAAVECQIVNDVSQAMGTLRLMKRRAPTSSDLYPNGAWRRWKEGKAAGDPSDP